MNNKKTKVLEIIGLTYTYVNSSNSIEIFTNLNFDMQEGEMAALLGPSGSGKSTLLNCIGLIDKPNKGVIKILGQNCNLLSDRSITKIRSKHIGFIFQNHRLFPEFSSMENVIIPQLLEGQNKVTAEKNSTEILNFLGLKNRLHHRPGNLSGGEAQRVAVIRALVRQPDLIVADEPTGAQDREHTWALMEQFVIANRAGASVVLATHDREIVRKVRKRCAILNQGKLSIEDLRCIY